MNCWIVSECQLDGYDWGKVVPKEVFLSQSRAEEYMKELRSKEDDRFCKYSISMVKFTAHIMEWKD